MEAMSLRRECDLLISLLACAGAEVGCLESRGMVAGNESVAAVIIWCVIVSERSTRSLVVDGNVSGMVDVNEWRVVW